MVNIESDNITDMKMAASDDASSALNSQYKALLDSIPTSGLKCDILFLVIKNRIAEEPDYVKKLRVVFQFNITKEGKHAATWTCDTKSCIEGDIYRSLPKQGIKPDVILTVDDEDWVKIMAGKLNPQRAFMMSKFKIKGNIMLLQKLHALWFELRTNGKTPELDLLQDVMISETLIPGLKSEAMSIEIVQRIVRLPHLMKEINANIQVNILKNGRLATIYSIEMMNNDKPVFRRGELPMKPDVTFTIEDDDLVLLIYGIHKVDESIACGRIKVDGKFEIVERAKALFDQAPILSRL